MDYMSRRNILTAATADGSLPAVTAAHAQSSEPLPEPQRPGRGGTDPVRAISGGTGKILICSCRRLPITAPCQTCVSHFPMRICG